MFSYVKRKIKSCNEKLVNDLASIKVTLLNYTPLENIYEYTDELYDTQFNRELTKWDFEKNHIVIWFYSREFVKYLKNNFIEVDPNRANQDQGAINKKLALTVVKYYK